MLKAINKNKKETGRRIKELRKEAGYKTAQAFSEKLGYSRQSVSKWENGDIMPTLDALYDIESLLDCDIGYLLCIYDTRYYEHADICEQTGLSEKAVETLKKELEYLQSENKFLKRMEKPIKKATRTTNFINFILVNGAPVFSAVNDLIFHNSAIESLKHDKNYEAIKEVFEEVCQGGLSSFEFHREKFYDKLQDKLYDDYVAEGRKLASEIFGEFENEPFNEKETLSDLFVRKVFEKDFYASIGTFSTLEMEKNARYFKYEISDAFMDIVKAFLEKESAEDGRKDELHD